MGEWGVPHNVSLITTIVAALGLALAMIAIFQRPLGQKEPGLIACAERDFERISN